MEEPFSLKMYFGSAKTYDFCMFVCFAFMYATLSSQIKRVHRQNIRKLNSISNVRKMVSYRYVSYPKSKTSDIWRTDAWFLKPFGERVDENHM